MVQKSGLALVILATSLVGCAKLKVTVDVLDPEYVHQVRSELRFNRLIRESATGANAVTLAIRNLCSVYQLGTLQLYDVSLRRLRAIESPAPALAVAIEASEDSRNAVATQIPETDCVKGKGNGGFIDEVALQGQFRSIACPDGQCATASTNTDDDLGSRRLTAAIEYQGRLDYYAMEINRRLAKMQSALGDQVSDAIVASAAPDAATTKAEFSRAQSEILEAAAEEALRQAREAGYLGEEGGTLVLDDIAFAVRNAHPDQWGERLNHAEGSGFLGSTDVVLKLEGTGDFSVKGLVFDARSTALAARKVTLSTLQLLAAGSGLPVSTTPSGEGDDQQGQPSAATTQVSQSLASAKAKLAAEELSVAHYEAALRRIASATLAAAERARSKDSESEQIKSSRKIAKQVFAANRSSLQAQTKTEANP